MAIDPRISARRVAVRRAEGRRRLRFLVTAVGLVALAVAAWGLTRTPLLDLDNVHYDGVTADDLAVVEDTAAFVNGTSMFDLDLGRVESDLRAIPWVVTATADREWPGTVRITVITRVEVAQVGLPGKRTLLADATGVLTRPAPARSSLPRVAISPSVELGEVDEAALPGIEVAVALPADLTAWVDAVTIAERTGSDERPILGLDLVGSAVAELGSPDFIDDKLAAVRAVLDRADLDCVDVIDVAVADSPTMTRRDGCEAVDTSSTEESDA